MSHESTSTPEQGHAEGEVALAELGPRLAAIDEARIQRPSADPHAAAVTALLVADYLAHAELHERLESVGMTVESVTDLRHLARAILAVVHQLGGDYLPDAKGVPGDLVSRGEGLRTAVSAALEKELAEDRGVGEWLEAIRLGHGVVDLVYDLRTLAELCAQHPAAEAASQTSKAAVLAAADAVEFALRADDTPELTQARNTLARLWTLFLPAYDRAATAGRDLTRGEGRERQFPPLALVASHRRSRRRPLSVIPPGGLPAGHRRTLSPQPVHPSARPGSTRPSTSAAAERSSTKIPIAAAVPDFEATPVALYEADSREAAEVARAETPHKPASVPPTAAERESWSDTRLKLRHTVEIEVGIASQSNLYLGFTENLSAAGVFVATYVSKPLGTHVEIALTFPNGDEVRVPGVVRWLREASADGWPGMGVQFEGLSDDDDAKIRKFLSVRDPLFYDD
jgi:uncharacterized protein (TIGR02266 family)